MTKKLLPLLTILLLLTLFLPCFSSARDKQEPIIQNVAIQDKNHNIIVSATTAHAFNNEMIEGIHSGFTITFTFIIQINKENDFWFDETVTEQRFNHTISYDLIKQQYKIKLTEKQNQITSTPSLSEAKKIMAEFTDYPVIEKRLLDKNKTYQIRIKTILEKGPLPTWLDYVMPFSSLWSFSTDWYTTEYKNN